MSSNNFIDLHKHILQYNNKTAIIAIDINGDLWFKAKDIALIFGYNDQDTKKYIKRKIPSHHKTT